MTSKQSERARPTSSGIKPSLENRAQSSDDHELEYSITFIVFYPELNLCRFYARAAAEFKGWSVDVLSHVRSPDSPSDLAETQAGEGEQVFASCSGRTGQTGRRFI